MTWHGGVGRTRRPPTLTEATWRRGELQPTPRVRYRRATNTMAVVVEAAGPRYQHWTQDIVMLLDLNGSVAGVYPTLVHATAT